MSATATRPTTRTVYRPCGTVAGVPHVIPGPDFDALAPAAEYRRARELADGGSWCVDVVRVPVDGFPSGYDTMRFLLAGEGSSVVGTGLTLRRITAGVNGVCLTYVTADGFEVTDYLTRRDVTP